MSGLIQLGKKPRSRSGDGQGLTTGFLWMPNTATWRSRRTTTTCHTVQSRPSAWQAEAPPRNSAVASDTTLGMLIGQSAREQSLVGNE